jgi:hypothetical protein
MSEKSTEPTTQPFDEETDPDGYKLSEVLADDFFLDTFLSPIASATVRGKFGMVLNCGGVVVSGLVIGYREYVERTAELLEHAQGKSPEPAAGQGPSEGAGLGAVITEAWTSVLDGWEKKDREREDAGLMTRTPRYVHMRDARIYAGSESIDVPLWRGSVESVTGWSLGSHNPPGA